MGRPIRQHQWQLCESGDRFCFSKIGRDPVWASRLLTQTLWCCPTGGFFVQTGAGPGDEPMVEWLEDLEKTCTQHYALWRHSPPYAEMPRLGHVSLEARRDCASTFLNLGNV